MIGLLCDRWSNSTVVVLKKRSAAMCREEDSRIRTRFMNGFWIIIIMRCLCVCVCCTTYSAWWVQYAVMLIQEHSMYLKECDHDRVRYHQDRDFDGASFTLELISYIYLLKEGCVSFVLDTRADDRPDSDIRICFYCIFRKFSLVMDWLLRKGTLEERHK